MGSFITKEQKEEDKCISTIRNINAYAQWLQEEQDRVNVLLESKTKTTETQTPSLIEEKEQKKQNEIKQEVQQPNQQPNVVIINLPGQVVYRDIPNDNRNYLRGNKWRRAAGRSRRLWYAKMGYPFNAGPPKRQYDN